MGLGAGVYYPLEVSYKDHTQEIGHMRVFSLQTNGDDFAANQTAVEALIAALNGACLGTLVSWQWGDLTIINPVDYPSNPSAQRENKLLVRYHDVSTFAKMTATIPTINLPGLVFLSEAQDYVSTLAPTFIENLVGAWGAAVVNPNTGNLTAIDSLEFVGRRS